MAKSLRRLIMGLQTLSGLRRQGYFIPYRYADRVTPCQLRRTYPAVRALFEHHQAQFDDALLSLNDHREALLRFSNARPPLPRWQQDWYPRLDGAMAYALTQRLRPTRIVEIGSGHSTRFFAAAVHDADLDTQLIAIDPAPRADLDRLRGVELHRTTVQHSDDTVIGKLRPGDFFVIDSSHIAVPGSDVDWLLTEQLARLPRGVFVHIHDVFLPDPYPSSWAWRGYNEQTVVAALLLGGGYEPVWSSHWAVTRMSAALRISVATHIPLPSGAIESALWLRKRI